MKKLILAVMSFVIVFALVGCSSNDSSAADEGKEETNTEVEASTETDEDVESVKTIKLICPYGVGGTADAILRKYALVASKHYPDKEFIVENMTGGDGFAACTYYSELPSDTKELIMYGYGAAYRHDLGKEFGTEVVDWDRDNFQPIACMDDRTWIMYAAPGTELSDVIEKAQNGGVKMSGGNPLSDPHLALGSLMAKFDGSVLVVPYDGGAQQMKALKDGEVDVFIGTTQAGKDETEMGNLVPILSFSVDPFEGFVGPDGNISVPTLSGDNIAEELVGDVDFSEYVLPAGGFVTTRTGASQAWVDEVTEISKTVWADEEYSGWIEEIMLNVVDIYNEDAIAKLDEGCEKAIDAFSLLSKSN